MYRPEVRPAGDALTRYAARVNGATIRTVLGEVPAEAIGATLYHEHLAIDLRELRGDPDICLQEPDLLVEELRAARELGISGIVDQTCIGVGRDVAALQAVARGSGVHVVASTGFYLDPSFPPIVNTAPVERLAELLVAEAEDGIEGSGVRAGFIGEVGTSSGTMTAGEEKSLRAAARAARATGLGIATHTTDGTLGLEQARLLLDEGADPARIAIGHLDAGPYNGGYHGELARMGFLLGLDRFSNPRHSSEPERLELLLRLLDGGWAGQVLLSHDCARRSTLRANGGAGYGYLSETVVPVLRERGVDEATLHTILVENPRRLLAVPARG